MRLGETGATVRRLSWALLLITACQGRILDPAVAGPSGVDAGAPDPTDGGAAGRDGGTLTDAEVLPARGVVAVVPIRRLSAAQFHNTLRSLFPPPLGDALVARSTFPAAGARAGQVSGFSSDADNTTVSTADAAAIEDNAEQLADYLFAQAEVALPLLMPASCAVAAGASDAALDACMPSFIGLFGARAWRRPLSTTEVTRVHAMYTRVRAEQPAREAWSALMQFFLASPDLLYRPERGIGVEGVVALTPLEVATRLAFLITDGPPSEALIAAAQRPDFSPTTEARQLLASPAAAEVFGRFLREWLRVDLLEALDDQSTTVPPAVRDDLLRELTDLSRTQLLGGGSLRALFLTDRFPVTPSTAPLYGQPGGDGSDVVVSDRRGVLSSPAFLTAHAPAGHQVPILRGAFLRKQVLCQTLATLPAGVDLEGPLSGARNLPTARQRLEPTTTRSDCRGCHTQFNPLGLALENYDALGRFRATENGAAIDASGELELGGQRWSFTTGEEFLRVLGESRLLTDCAAERWFHFVLGRPVQPSERPFVDALAAASRGTGATAEQLVVDLVQSEAFTHFLREQP